MDAPGEGIGEDAAFNTQRLPVDDLVHWRSTNEPTTAPFAEPYPILLQQAPLVQIVTHVHSAPAKTLLGFLLGGLYQCPKSGVRYVCINEIVCVRAEVSGDQTADMLARLWPQLRERVTTGPQQLIGWYHSHPHGALPLSREDVGSHMMYFTQPWQAGLVLGAEEGKPAAAWFRATAEDDNWHRSQLPFYEWLTRESEAGAKKRSFVPWGNYKSYRATWPQPRPPEPEPAPPAVLDPSAEITAMVEARAAASRPEEPLPPPRSSFEDEPSPLVHRPLVSAHVSQRPAPPATARWKIWGAGILGALVLGVVVAGGWAVGLVHFGRLPGGGSASEGGAATTAAAPSGPAAQLAHLDLLADSVQRAVSAYRTRRARFNGRQGSCGPLGQALVAVEEHWMGYNARGKPRDLTLDARRAARDRTLYARVDSIESDFDRSTCPRP